MGVTPLREMNSAELKSDDGEEGCPDSWEMADLEANMIRLMPVSSQGQQEPPPVETGPEFVGGVPPVQVDEFLREALQNPNDRLTILRLEQEVEKFVRNPAQQQLEFPAMPSSYMRLAAHRVAQHYYLQTSVIDGSYAEGCRILVRKSGDTRSPATRLADVPVTHQEENQAAMKFVIKQRPQDKLHSVGGLGGGTGRRGSNPAKSVEERNEEYNKARARIFREQRAHDELVELESRCQKLAEAVKETTEQSRRNTNPTPAAAPSGGKESAKSKQKVAIFRDREKDRKDPDYDRSYDRYSQRFDPGFGLNSNQPTYGLQARYTPVINYNTEFPQLGCPVRPMPAQGHHVGQQVQGWSPAYQQRQDMLRPPFNPAGLSPHSNVATYMSQYAAYPQHSMSYTYSSQISQQPEANSTQARRR